MSRHRRDRGSDSRARIRSGRGKNTETLERSFKASHASRVGEHLVHLRGRETLQGRNDVGVRVERQTDLRMPEVSMIVRGSTPCASRSVAAVCRKSW